jgi:hypothetical protein
MKNFITVVCILFVLGVACDCWNGIFRDCNDIREDMAKATSEGKFYKLDGLAGELVNYHRKENPRGSGLRCEKCKDR